tara:strand:- start:58 stop:759 length:702 start_codon:yes stop_codon:yes gene_type:complete
MYLNYLLTLAKRVSEKQKEEIIQSFTSGKSLDALSKDFDFTKLTISRTLKKNLGEEKYKELIQNNKRSNQSDLPEDKTLFEGNSKAQEEKIQKDSFINNQTEHNHEEEYLHINSFTEITPLNCEIENTLQKDFSSVPISVFEFPKMVYMIVDKKIELETKYLKEYSEWQFLSQDELNRKTIQIFEDLKNAKRFCSKEQKVIKVPNTDVFKIVSPILVSRGISRIVSDDKLIAL